MTRSEGARARWRICRKVLGFWTKQPVAHATIPLDCDYAIRPSQFLSFNPRGPRDAGRAAARRARALADHAGQLGIAPAQLAGRPTSTVLVPTLGGGTGVAELAKMVATASGHSCWCHGHSDHPRPLHSYQASA
jgi:hypothetical protein